MRTAQVTASETERSPSVTDGSSTPLEISGGLVALLTLAITHPVLETLAGSPEFFILRTGPRLSAAAAGLLIGVLLPAGVAGTVLGVRRLHRRTGEALHGVLVTALGSLLGLHLVRATLGWGGGAGLALAVLVGVGIRGALRHLDALRGLAPWGLLLPVASLGLLILTSPVSGMLLPTEAAATTASTDARPVAVTVIVLDELPTGTLMAGPDRIDRQRFPGFAAFADDAVWYRNATTAADTTVDGVPAVLTGRSTPPESLPIVADHPTNLFTILSGTHDVRAVEEYTRLCPRRICGQDRGRPLLADLAQLVRDLSLVGTHVTLPEQMADGLPPLEAWAGRPGGEAPGRTELSHDIFRQGQAIKRGDRRDPFRGAVRAASDRPPATILHTILPHRPFSYLPTGQRVTYEGTGGIETVGVRSPDEWMARYEQRRHLLQTGLADRILGDTLDDLRRAGLYEDGMVVVTADHGVSFQPGVNRRWARPENLHEVAAVPLLVKYPSGRGGVVDRRPAQTIDVVPTILDVLDVPVPSSVKGRSLLRPPDPHRSRTINGPDDELVPVPPDVDPWRLGRQTVRDFGTGWRGVWAHGPFAGLTGRPLESLPPATDGPAAATIDDLGAILRSRPDSDPLPSALAGRITFATPPDGHRFVAVVFDGTVVAVGRTYEPDDAPTGLLALVPPRAWAGGVEQVDLLALAESPAGPTLERIALRPAP